MINYPSLTIISDLSATAKKYRRRPAQRGLPKARVSPVSNTAFLSPDTDVYLDAYV
jgi:hypothetical protein